MAFSTSLRPLVSDMKHYEERHDYFYGKPNSREAIRDWIQEEFDPAVVKKLEESLMMGKIHGSQPFRFLRVGGAEGELELQQVKMLSTKFPNIAVDVVEPTTRMIDQYQDRVRGPNPSHDETSNITFEWHNLTLHEFLKPMKREEEKYHFISLIHMIYFIGDPEEIMQRLYGMLEDGGIMLLVVVSGETGTLGSVPLGETNTTNADSIPVASTTSSNYKTDSSQIEKILDKMKAPYTKSNFTEWIDVTLLVAGEVDSKEANLLLDFLTLTVDFKATASDEVYHQVLGYFKDNARTERSSPDSKETFHLINNCTNFIITK